MAERTLNKGNVELDWKTPEAVAPHFDADPQDPALLSALLDFHQVVDRAPIRSFLKVVFSKKLKEARSRPVHENQRIVDQYHAMQAESEVLSNVS